MGIKGIYKELGPGKRVSLSKLTADSLATDGRPLRVAIDIAIWQFQTQVARGGTNPAIRVLFYRLARLLSTPILPIFVFDGPLKPAVKRNKRSARGSTSTLAAAQAKRLINLFGLPIHDAPGEAEAECALLQRHGVVDAVLSEDVDTIMFGCTRTLRNWSAEGSKTAKTPTHVTVYEVEEIKKLKLGLDREGMVLVAMMSGGDYAPEGIPGCGVKVACEAARAGFGKSLCRLKSADTEGLRSWRESLKHELQTNEKGYFRVKHKALQVPDDFPNLEILRFYTHPIVSKTADLPAIREKFDRPREMHIGSLREFTRETFGWDFRIGAIKFIRVLGQALLVRQMLQDPSLAATHIDRITGSRRHFSTDGTSELRISYTPNAVVPIDLSTEVDEVVSSGREGLALNSDDDFEVLEDTVSAANGSVKVFDVTKPDLAWVLEELARKAVPSAVSAWGEAEAAKAQRKSPKKATRAKKAPDPQKGAMDQYVKATKSTALQPSESATSKTPSSPAKPSSPSKPRPRLRRPSTPPFLEDSSKPSTPSTSEVPVCDGARRTLFSSHAPPSHRTPPQKTSCSQQPLETIVISSSPAGEGDDVFSSRPTVRRALAPAAATDGAPREVAESVRQILAEGGKTGEMSERTDRMARDYATSNIPRPTAATKPKMKQTSMDVFTTRHTNPPSTSPKPHGHPPPTSSNSPITISSSPISPSKRQSSASPPPQPRQPSQSPTRACSKLPQKKKLYVPRASASGFFTTVEVSYEDVDDVFEEQTRRLQARGVKAGVVRWSDVSEIDLTGEDGSGWVE